MSKARQDLGTRIQRGDHAQCAGSLVPEAERAYRSPAARFAVDEPNQGKVNAIRTSKLRCNARAVLSRFTSSIKKITKLLRKDIYVYLSGWFLTSLFFFSSRPLFSLFSRDLSTIFLGRSGDPRHNLGLFHCSQYIADTRCGTYRLYTLVLHHPPSRSLRFPMITCITTRIRITTCFCISHQCHSRENSRHSRNRLQTRASSVSNFSAIYKSCLL